MTSKTIKAKIRSLNGSVTTSRVKVCNKTVQKNIEKSYKAEMIKQQTNPRHNQSAFKGGR